MLASPSFLGRQNSGFRSPIQKEFDWDKIAAPRWRDFTTSTPVGKVPDAWFDSRHDSFLGEDSDLMIDPACDLGASPTSIAKLPAAARGVDEPAPAKTAAKPTVPTGFQFATDVRMEVRRKTKHAAAIAAAAVVAEPVEEQRRKTKRPERVQQLTLPESPRFATTQRSAVRRLRDEVEDERDAVKEPRRPAAREQPSRPALTCPSSPVFATTQRSAVRRLQHDNNGNDDEHDDSKPARRMTSKPPAQRLALTCPSSPVFATSQRSAMRRLQSEHQPDNDSDSDDCKPARRMTSKPPAQRPALTCPSSPQLATSQRAVVHRQQAASSADSEPPVETRRSTRAAKRMTLTCPSSPVFATSQRSELRRAQASAEQHDNDSDHSERDTKRRRTTRSVQQRLELTCPASPRFATADRAQIWHSRRETSGAAASPPRRRTTTAALRRAKSAVKPTASVSRLRPHQLTVPSTPQFHTRERAQLREQFQREHRKEIVYPTQVDTQPARRKTSQRAPAHLQLTLPSTPQFATSQRAAVRQKLDLDRTVARLRDSTELPRRPFDRLRLDTNAAVVQPPPRKALTLPQSPHFKTTQRAQLRQHIVAAAADENAVPATAAVMVKKKPAARPALTTPHSPNFQTSCRAAVRKAGLVDVAEQQPLRAKTARPAQRLLPTAPSSPHFQPSRSAKRQAIRS